MTLPTAQRVSYSTYVPTVLKPAAQPDRGNFMDIYMMLYGGRERRESDFRTLLQQAGFSLLRMVPTATGAYILECEPV